MIKPFRKYVTIMDRLNGNTGEAQSAQLTINLYDVRDWEECTDDFNDKSPVGRTIITMHNGQSTAIRVPYSSFDEIMDRFLKEAGLLDLGTIKKKVDKNGPVKFHFNGTGQFIIGCAFPDWYKINQFDPIGVNEHMIDHGVTTLN